MRHEFNWCQFWPPGFAVACVCFRTTCVNKFVCVITYHPFRLWSPNLDQACKTTWLRLCCLVRLTFTSKVKLNSKIKIYPLFELVHPITHHQLKLEPTNWDNWNNKTPWLTNWGQATHICVCEIIIISSDNGLSPGRRQAIIWTNVGILLIGPLGINFSEILIAINTFSFKKMHLKMSSAKWRLFRLGLNVLRSLLF